MAHGWRGGSRLLTAAGALALALVASQARALVLGEPELRSALGESLDLRFPVTLAPGESIDPRCFTLASEAGAALAPNAGVTISIERSLGKTRLRIRSAAPLTNPALALAVVARCPGLASEQRREYAVTLDPRPTTGSAATVATALQEVVATLIARIGDTLESIARAVFPDSPPARAGYIEAMRQANPALAPLGESDPVPPGTPIALPDLRTYAKHLAHRPVTTLAERPQAPAPIARPAAPRSAPAAPHEPVAKPEPTPAPSAHPKVASTPQPAPRRTRSEGYVLKLSAPVVDLSRSGAINDRQRAQLRDRLLVLDTDDQVAALLALRNSVRQLESRVTELQLKLAGMPNAFPVPRPEAALPAPPKVEAPKVAAPRIESPQAEPPKVARAPAAATTATTPVGVPEPRAAPPPLAPDASSATPWIATISDWARPALWGLAILLFGAAALLAARFARRGRSAPARASEPSTVLAEEPIVVA